jgi:L-ascorbate metabolism protein UlaG (beta-lactamase superfamily)
MTLTKFEQSGFILETENGFRVAIDIGNRTPLEKLEGISPVDLFVISHIHGDHFSPDHIKKLFPATVILPKECYDVLDPASTKLPVGAKMAHEVMHPKVEADLIISGEGFVYENDAIKMSFFHVDHGPNVSVPVDNYGFLIEADGKTVYFAGDMFYPSGIDVSGLEVDYALIPVGTFYTFGPEEAFAFAKRFKFIRNLVPMHDRGEPEHTQQFIELAGKDFNVVVM